MMRSDQKLATLLLSVAWAMILICGMPEPAYAVLPPLPDFSNMSTPEPLAKNIGGYVGARSIVRLESEESGEDGEPLKYAVWVEYDKNGKIVGRVADAVDEYVDAEAVSLAEYVARTGDKTSRPDIASVLVDANNKILATSKYTIGYWSAYYVPKEDPEPLAFNYGLTSMYDFGFGGDKTVCGPVEGAIVDLLWSRTVTDDTGGYGPLRVPIGDGLVPLNVILNFSTFDPDQPTAKFITGYYVVLSVNRTYDYTSFGTYLYWLSSNASYGAIGVRHNLAVDVSMLTGKGVLYGAEPGDVTTYTYDKPLYTYKNPPPGLDMNNDGQPDTVMPNKTTGEVRAWYDGAAPGDPDYTFQMDFTPNSADIWYGGFVDTITEEDLENTDIYVYRLSTGQRIAARDGLKSDESNPYHGGGADDDLIHYRMLMRGPTSFLRNWGSARGQMLTEYQESMYMNTELRGLENDYLRAGEKIKIYMVNRATGYIGSAIADYSAADNLTIVCPPVFMFPPNLKVKAERKYKIEAGATKGEEPEPDKVIGFEGAGLSSDEYIAVSTQWFDIDGTPLPDDLPGFTGRLAKVLSENTLEACSGIADFDIKPGAHKVVVKLSGDIEKAHYYLHVNGESKSGLPDFSGAFQETADFSPPADPTGVDPLFQYRPKHFVPFMVPVYSKKTDGYDWVYRPEMQFSVFDLKMDAKPDDPGGSTLICSEYKYLLTGSALPDLERFGYLRELLFGYPLGFAFVDDSDIGIYPERIYNEVKAVLGSSQTLTYDGIMTLRLYQNGDEPNILWQYDAAQIKLEVEDRYIGEQCIVHADDNVGVRAVTKPAGIQVSWSITRKVPEDEKKPIRVRMTDITDSDCRIAADRDTGNGYIIIRATAKSDSRLYNEGALYVGCGEFCPACQKPGGGWINLSSVNARFSMGDTIGGVPAGDILLHADTLTQEVATPNGLFISTLTDGLEIIRDQNGPRQILSRQTLADIIILDAYGYEIRFYQSDAIAGQGDGLYTTDPSVSPYVTWKVENPDRTDDTVARLRITETRDSQTKTYQYLQDGDTWSLNKGGGLAVFSKAEVIDPATGDRILTETTSDAAGHLAAKTRSTWHTFAWGEEIVQSITDPDNAALTTTYEYYENPDESGYTRKMQETRPDGSWTRYHYDAEGRVISRVSGWLDGDSASTPAVSRVIQYNYEPVDPEDAGRAEHQFDPRTTIELINGITVSKTFTSYRHDADSQTEIMETCLSPDAAFGDPANLRTVRIYYPSGLERTSGRLKKAIYPDGRMDTYAYEFGTWNSGVFVAGAGDAERREVIHGTVEHPEGVAFKTTREISFTDNLGHMVRTESHVYTGTGYQQLSYTENVYDWFGNPVQSNASNGTKTEVVWGCCGKESETSATGIETTYAYDDLKRPIAITKTGFAGQADVTTAYTYDALGRWVAATVSADDFEATTTTEYDTTGRVLSQTDAQGLTTAYVYADDGRTTTVIRPTGTEITIRYRDGRTKSVTGTAVIARYYTYGVNPDGTRWTQVNTGAQDSLAWERTTTDLAGRTIRTEKPGPQGTVLTTENEYNTYSQLVRTTATSSADILYLYDDLGRQIRTGLDIDHNGSLDLASMDRINKTDTGYVKEGTEWWQQNQQIVYAASNDATPTTVATQRTQISGLGINSETAESVSIDIHGNITRTQAFVDRDARTETRLVEYPDSDTSARTVTINGLLVSSQSKTGITITFAYDPLGRRIGTIDPRTGTAVTHYDEYDRVDYVQDAAGNKTTFSYDETTGRKIAGTNALGKATRYSYNNHGQVIRTWGDAAYPVEYVYDDYGRMVQMRTFRTEAGWDAANWPDGTAGDTTTWGYDPATGLLMEKTDARGNSVIYTYDDAERLATRTWARTDNGNPIVTTYTYDPATGELTDIDYSDETPDIDFSYDRIGRKKTVTDVMGSRSFAYNDQLQLQTETIAGLISKTITREYAEGIRMKGCATGFNLGPDYRVAYGFDNKGRFKTLTWNAADQTDTATYGYVENSDLTGSLSTTNGLITDYTYEPHRNLKTRIDNAYNTALISQYDYEYDTLGRRMSVQNSGTAFANDAFNTYGYNDRNELTGSNRYQGTDVDDLSAPVDPETRLYDYDPIGNRNTAIEGAASKSYAANSLNQYDEITAGGSTSTLTYDEDGNLTVMPAQAGIQSGGGQMVLSYNAENRLIAVEPRTPGEGDKKLEFTYDYMGRRVKKAVYDYAAGAWTLEQEKLFVYDGWNLVEEISDNGSNENSRYFVWGLDLSQSLQGAGGIGGLIAAVDGADTYYFTYDGNGNVGQVINVASSTIAATYQYDPFGNQIKADGIYSNDNPFRFSTKYHDDGTGLVYYGYRYYSAELGRWLSRDPIEERGGVNLQAFAYNNAINNLDKLGNDVNIAYRRLGFTAFWLDKAFPAAGHVYLAFDNNNMSTNWEKTLKDLGYGTQDLYTFSFHPDSVRTHNEKGNRASVAYTVTTFVDRNNEKYDIPSYNDGSAHKISVTTDECEQIAIFKKAHESWLENPGGPVDEGAYSFLIHNCGSWAQETVQAAGVKWPLEAYFLNGGTGLGGPMDYTGLPQTAYAVVVIGYHAFDIIDRTGRVLNDYVEFDGIPLTNEYGEEAGRIPGITIRF